MLWTKTAYEFKNNPSATKKAKRNKTLAVWSITFLTELVLSLGQEQSYPYIDPITVLILTIDYKKELQISQKEGCIINLINAFFYVLYFHQNPVSTKLVATLFTKLYP